MRSMDIDEYDYLWLGPETGWVLARNPPLPGDTEPRYVIYNRLDQSALVIEDDAKAEAVVQEMLRRGVPIIGPGER